MFRTDNYRELLKYILVIEKQLLKNLSKYIKNQTNHRWTLGQLKDLEISKYKRDSNNNFIILFLLIVVLFGFRNIKSVKDIKIKTALQMEIYYVREYTLTGFVDYYLRIYIWSVFSITYIKCLL